MPVAVSGLEIAVERSEIVPPFRSHEQLLASTRVVEPQQMKSVFAAR